MKKIIAKRNLATLALVILLSLACVTSATYAIAFSSTGKVTGNISIISPDLSMTVTATNGGIISLGSNTVTINITTANVEFINGDKMKLNKAAQDAINSIKFSTTFTPSGNAKNYSITTTNSTNDTSFAGLFSFVQPEATARTASVGATKLFNATGSAVAVKSVDITINITLKAEINL